MLKCYYPKCAIRLPSYHSLSLSLSIYLCIDWMFQQKKVAVAFISYFDLPEKGSFAVATPRQYQMEEFFPERKDEERVSKRKEIGPLDESIEVSLEDSTRQVESSS